MPKGGARVNSGPPPDPQALRRDRQQDRDGWTTLPAEGRKGDPPAWPFPGSSERELEVWTEIWSTPQAVAWERLGWRHEIAMYVRLLVVGEAAESVAAITEARQWSDRLGLNPAAMLRNRWKVAADETKVRREQRQQGSDVRDRLKALSGGAR